MHTMSRLLFGLAFLLIFSIGCQKNPTAVRATANAAGKCDPELLKKLEEVKAVKKTIDEAKDQSKMASQISTKAAQCKAIIDTYGKGKLEALDCTIDAKAKTKLTTTEVKSVCGSEMAKPGSPGNPANDPSKMTNFCSDKVTSYLQNLLNQDAKKEEISKVQKQDEKTKKANELIKETVAICNDLYPFMPDQCKAEITLDNKKETKGFLVQQIKELCEQAIKDNKARNGVDGALPVRNSGTIDESGRRDPNVPDPQRQPVLEKAREEAANNLKAAQKDLKEKQDLKTAADAAALAAKTAADADPADEAKKKDAADKATAAKKAADDVVAAEKLVKDLTAKAQEAEEAAKKAAAAPATAVRSEPLKVELVEKFKEKVEKVQVVKVETLRQVFAAEPNENNKSYLLSGAVVTFQQYKDKAKAGEKGIICRATVLPAELKNGEAEIVDVSDDNTTSELQALNLQLKSKEGDLAFSIRCGKYSKTEQMSLEDVEASLKGVVTLVKKTTATPPPAQPPAPAPAAVPPVAAPAAAPAAPVAAVPQANAINMFTGKVLKIALGSFFVLSNEPFTEDINTSKSIISGIAIDATNAARARATITPDAAKANYQAGKTVCTVAERGNKLAEKDLEGSGIQAVLKHRVVSAVIYKAQGYNTIRIQTAAVSTSAADEKDMSKSAGAKFTCIKSGDTITLEDVKQGLQGAVNSIN